MQIRIISLVAVASCCIAQPVWARNTVVSGKIGVGVDFWERTYDNEVGETDDSRGKKRQIGFWPEISIISDSPKDSLLFRYAPVLKYDDVTSETDLDHYLSASGQRFINRNWSVNISDNFWLTDDPGFSSERFAAGTDTGAGDPTPDTEAPPPTITDEQQAESISGDEITRDAGRSRYWTNALSASTNYAFAENSSVGGGYTFTVLRNDSDGESLNEYDKHAFFGNLAYAFSQSWQSSLGLNYTRGLYDDVVGDEDVEGVNTSDDLHQYGANAKVDYMHSPSDSFPFVYDFSGTDYDSDLRGDSYAHNFSIGWDHAFDSRTRLVIGVGPSYADAEGVKGEWDYNIYLEFTRDYEHAAFGLLLDKRYDTQNFSGSDNSGLKDTYNASLTFNYQYTQNLSFNLLGKYRWESNLDPQGSLFIPVDEENPDQEPSITDVTYDKNIYEASAGLSYDFLRYYTAGFRYTYYVSDGEQDNDQYSDHRFMLTLTASNDLWRW